MATYNPLAVRSKLSVCSGFVSGNAGSNTDRSIGIDVLCLLCVVYVAAGVTSWSLVRRSDTGCVCV